MVKPDGVQRGLVGEIIKRFEQKGFKLVAMKFMQVGRNNYIYSTFPKDLDSTHTSYDFKKEDNTLDFTRHV